MVMQPQAKVSRRGLVVVLGGFFLALGLIAVVLAPQAEASYDCTIVPHAHYNGVQPLETTTVTFWGELRCSGNDPYLFGGQASLYSPTDPVTPLRAATSLQCPNRVNATCTTGRSQSTLSNVSVGTALQLRFSTAVTLRPGKRWTSTLWMGGNVVPAEQRASLCSGYNSSTVRCLFVKDFVVQAGAPGATITHEDEYNLQSEEAPIVRWDGS